MGLFDFIKKKKSRVQIIIEKLNSDLVEADFSSDWKLRQIINLKLLWINLIRNQDNLIAESLPPNFPNIFSGSKESELSVSDIKFPKTLDVNELIHWKFAEQIINKSNSIILSPNNFKGCLWKPESILPYPKDFIIDAINFTQNCLMMEKPLFEIPQNRKEILINFQNLRIFLRHFLDCDESELSASPERNIEDAKKIRQRNL